MDDLRERIAELFRQGDICLAFSGGVDSSLLLRLASDAVQAPEAAAAGRKLYAVTFQTVLHAAADLEDARKIAAETAAEHHIIEVNELDNSAILDNPPDRCYLCKFYLFQKMIEYGKKQGAVIFMDGTNRDDLDVYRPGIRALHELGVLSPLAELGIRKAEVRQMAKELGLKCASKPSAPCLATRLPYGTRLNPKLLNKIAQGEEYMKSVGFGTVRLRLHEDVVRLEVPAEDFGRLVTEREEICSHLKALGFMYITLDLEGFRSGSMDIGLAGLEK